MKNGLLTVLIALLFVAGLGIFLYPLISDIINAQYQTRAVISYHDAVRSMDDTRIVEILAAARRYNDALPSNPDRFNPTDAELEEYRGQLRVTGSMVIGTLEIAAIGVNLPIYHGTGDSELQVGAGHLEGSSLPVGGPGTHTVITGHRGLPSSTLLTNLDRLAPGDVFTLRVLNETMRYEIDQIRIVLPEDYSELAIDPDMDYCTLLTCTPYGINSHRMLIRGKRTELETVRTTILSESRVVGIFPAMPIALGGVAAVVLPTRALVLWGMRKKRLRLSRQ
jgi:sortase A